MGWTAGKRRTIALLSAAVLGLGGAAEAHATPLKFDVAGVEFTLPDGGWEVRKIAPARQRINFDTGGFDTRNIERRLLVLRSESGKLLSVLLVTGGLGEGTSVRFRQKSCPLVPAADYYARSLAPRESDPLQCVLIGGPFDGPSTLRNTLEGTHSTLPESDQQPQGSVWQVLAFVTSTRGARYSVTGVVSADGFEGLPAAKPVAASPADVPPGVAAWADALIAALQTTIVGFGSQKAVLPRMTFTATGVPR